jgi:N6-L-threonylcarbamoyladenine synthase
LIIVGIESSCDETAVAIVEDGRKVLANRIASQVARHAPFGGVIPEIAAREHLSSISPLFELAIQDAGIKANDIDLVVVTQGPGLIGPLLIGANFARGLALSLGVPLLTVDHVHAHVLGALLDASDNELSNMFPAISMVVSGGHTNVYYMTSPTDFQLQGYSLDDACGESFDKVAKLLGLGYPGGPIVEQRAKQGDKKAFAMPTVLEQKDHIRFSYSGLKTHIGNIIRSFPQGMTEAQVNDLCASFQHAALDQIVRKLSRVKEKYSDTQSVIIAGGVAANQYFRELMSQNIGVPVFFPSLAYCGDNAAMIASLGYYQNQRSQRGKETPYDCSWEPYSRYRYEDV